jgi:23S rRNA (uridine2552-2'-O)-methyltransferase
MLKTSASFAAKMFQRSGSDEFVTALRKSVDKVPIPKPAASREELREVYIIARGFEH